jgi:hypothetical protein
VGIGPERHKGADVRERGKIAILIGLQNRDDPASFGLEFCEKFRGHALAIHDQTRHLAVSHKLFILCQQGGNTDCQMLIAAMGADKEGMALLVMQ